MQYELKKTYRLRSFIFFQWKWIEHSQPVWHIEAELKFIDSNDCIVQVKRLRNASMKKKLCPAHKSCISKLWRTLAPGTWFSYDYLLRSLKLWGFRTLDTKFAVAKWFGEGNQFSKSNANSVDKLSGNQQEIQGLKLLQG